MVGRQAGEGTGAGSGVAPGERSWHSGTMKPQWRLKVADFGRIAAADVTLRRLTLLVGPNNSGKSYLASLLWGLVALQFDLPPLEGPEVAEADAWLANAIPAGVSKGEISIESKDLRLFHRMFDALVEKNKDPLLQRIFNSQQVTAANLSFQNVAAPRTMKVAWSEAEGENRTHITIDDGLEPHDGLHGDVRTDTRLADIRDIIIRRVVFRRLFRLFAPFNDSYSTIDPVYLPASRTGFVQLYKAPARLSLRGAFRSTSEEFLDLSTPMFHFMDLISFGIRQTRRSNYAPEADFLEAGMSGRFELFDTTKGGAINEYRYRPESGNATLPMKLSSSLVTELGPLVLVLRHARSMPLLVLEEPEAHLHPSLQRRLAQVVVRLVRKGLCVWITTHSEDFCQQINNFIKLGSLPPDRRALAQRDLGFEDQDFLEQDDVAGNEFRIEPDGRSTVSEMKQTAAGLVMPSFNREILDLSKQATYLDGLLSEEER